MQALLGWTTLLRNGTIAPARMAREALEPDEIVAVAALAGTGGPEPA